MSQEIVVVEPTTITTDNADIAAKVAEAVAADTAAKVEAIAAKATKPVNLDKINVRKFLPTASIEAVTSFKVTNDKGEVLGTGETREAAWKAASEHVATLNLPEIKVEDAPKVQGVKLYQIVKKTDAGWVNAFNKLDGTVETYGSLATARATIRRQAEADYMFIAEEHKAVRFGSKLDDSGDEVKAS